MEQLNKMTNGLENNFNRTFSSSSESFDFTKFGPEENTMQVEDS